jgi:hypothetical protein
MGHPVQAGRSADGKGDGAKYFFSPFPMGRKAIPIGKTANCRWIGFLNCDPKTKPSIIMKIKSIAIVSALLVLAVSCKKENDEPPFSAPGLWEGNVYIYNSTLLLRQNGTTRLYMGTSNGDTSQTVNVFDGTFIVNGRSFRAEYDDGGMITILKADNVAGSTINGVMTNSAGALVDMKFTKKN